jgi:hypothetical protein
LRLLALGLSLLAGAALAAPTPFGDRTLDIPAPEGFVPSGAQVPQFLQISQGYLPPSNRLAEIYVTPDDLAAFQGGGGQPDLSRYLQLQVGRAVDGKPISAAGFEEARATMEAELEKALGTIDQTAPELAEKGNQQLKEITGNDAELKFGGVHYLGAFRREPWGLFFTVESKVSVSGSDPSANQSGTVVSAGGLVLINHQLLYLYAFSDEGETGREWAQRAVGAWADAVRAANPDDPALARDAVDLADHTDLFRYGGMAGGAIAGVIVALVLLAVRRAKNS